MKCHEVMSYDPVSCLPNETVSQVARTMRREHTGAVPVVSDERDRSLVGILTDRDLATKLVAESRDPNQTLVYDIMTRVVVACRDEDDLSSALMAMEEHDIKRIPVVDGAGRLVGIISQRDVSTRYPWRLHVVTDQYQAA